MAQPTLGRQVKALEQELDVVLFERAGHGLTLTPNGRKLLEHVRGMGEGASRVALAASGQSQSIEGTVCITTTETASAFVLPEIVARLRAAQPGITIDLVASNSVQDLRHREADIALRSARPTDPDLVAKRLRRETARLYASRSYLDRVGPLERNGDLSSVEFIGFEENEPFLDGLRKLGLPVDEGNFSVRCANHLVQWEMVKSGLGIGVMASLVGDGEPGVVPVAPWIPPFEYDIWLVAHREVNTSQRVRLVFDFLTDALTGK